MKVTQRHLEAWLREWQALLRLQDWDVRIELRREKDMKYEGCHGLSGYSVALKQALIMIRNPVDFSDERGFPNDVEATVVHELLHLHFAPFYITNGLTNKFQEQAVEVIARSLINLKRKGKTMGKKTKPAGTAAPAAPNNGVKKPGKSKKAGTGPAKPKGTVG